MTTTFKLDPAQIRPTGDRVLVMRDPTPKAMGRILVSDTDRNSRLIPKKGVVVAVGPGKLDEKTGERKPVDPAVKPGARVLIDYRKGDNMNDELQTDPDINWLMLPADAILGVEE